MKLPEPNEVFGGRYRLDAVLGHGGFAVVFRATDLSAERTVALKILTPQNGGYAPDVASRFTREVKIIAKLQDPHTVTLYDFGTSEDGLLYMVFEHVPGRDLYEVLEQEKQLAPSIAAHILRQVLLSLQEAHHMGLLHRDIKPENVRVFEYRGDPYRVKLLDFGIARPVLPDQQSITKTGELIGTPRYMSPEALIESDLGPYSDIYSLGLVTFEMVMGTAELQGHRWADQFDRLVSGHVFSLEEHERVGPGLRKIIERMTARDPADRFQSVDAVLRVLEQLMQPHSRDSIEVPRVTQAAAQAARVDPTLYEDSSPSSPDRRVFIDERAPPNRGLLIGLGILCLVTLIVGGGLLASGGDEEPGPVILLPRTNNALVRGSQPTKPGPVTTAVVDVGVAAIDVGPAPDLGENASAGCGVAPPFSGQGVFSLGGELSADGWPMHLPEDYDRYRPHALILMLHQDGRSGSYILEQSNLGAEAAKRGYIVVAPTYPGMNLFAWREPKQSWLKGLVETVSADLCIDSARVYAVGHGAGGNAIERLSCEDWIGGVATNGFRAENPTSSCESPAPYAHFTPMKSRRMPLNGGTNCVMSRLLSLAEHEGKWLDRNGCGSKKQRVVSHKNGKCWQYRCDDAPFLTCHVESGYGWPGRPNYREHDPLGCGDVIGEFPINTTLLDFFDSLAR